MVQKRLDHLTHSDVPQRRQSMRRQLLYLMGLLLLVSLVVVGASVYAFIADTEQRTWQSRQQETATIASATVHTFLERVEDTLVVAGAIDNDHYRLSPAMLMSILKHNPALLEVIRLDAQGAILASASRDTAVLANLFSIPQSTWFRQALAGERYLGSVQISSGNEPYLIIAIPAARDGVVAARLRMRVLWTVVEDIRFGQTGNAYVVNSEGQIIAHPDHQLVLGYANIAGRPEFEDLPADGLQRRYVNVAGTMVVGVATPIEQTPWWLFTELPQAEATSVSRTALLILGLVVLGFGVLVIGAITQLLNRLVFRPIDQLRIGTERIGLGDLQYHIAVDRNDEIGQVALAFNTMADRLSDRDEQLVAQTTTLTSEIAERARTEVQLAQARDAAEAANRAKSAFLATMSHELRTPLTAILGYTELMQHAIETGDTADIYQDLALIHTSGKHLLALISDILDLSKIEANRMSLEYEIIDIGAMVREALVTARPLVEKNGNQLILKYPPDIGTIEADPTKLRQVLLNLLSNAAKFTEQGTITLAVHRMHAAEREWVSWEVSDTGIGIAPEQLDRLFQPFLQINSTATRRYGGTGLGLTLSQRFCQLHGGRITAKSIPAVGSLFTVYLPAQRYGQVAETGLQSE